MVREFLYTVIISFFIIGAPSMIKTDEPKISQFVKDCWSHLPLQPSVSESE